MRAGRARETCACDGWRLAKEGAVPRACNKSERAALGASCTSKHPHPAQTSACTSGLSATYASSRSYSCSSSLVSITTVTPSSPPAPAPRSAARLERRRAPVAPTTNRTRRSTGRSGARQPALMSIARARVQPSPLPSSSAFPHPLAPDGSPPRTSAAAAREQRERRRQRKRCGASETATTTPGNATDFAASRPGANTVTTCPSAPPGSTARCRDLQGGQRARCSRCHSTLVSPDAGCVRGAGRISRGRLAESSRTGLNRCRLATACIARRIATSLPCDKPMARLLHLVSGLSLCVPPAPFPAAGSE